MNGFSAEKLNKRKNLLSLLLVALIAVFSINLALVTDIMLFAMFYVVTATAYCYLATDKSTVLSLCASFIGWVAAFMITENALFALLSISYIPFTLSIPCIARNKLSRSAAVAIGSAYLTVEVVAACLYVTYVRQGDISLSAIRGAFPFFFGQISELLYESFFVSVAGSKVSLIAESNVVGYLNVIICLIPAVISAFMTFVGFLIAWLYRKLVEITATRKINAGSWNLIPSPVTAVFFLFAFACVMIFESVNLVSLTALNMFIIILPVILLTGLLTSLTPIVTNGIPRPRLFRPLTLIISVFSGVVPFASLCIFYGLFDTFKASASKRKPKKQE